MIASLVGTLLPWLAGAAVVLLGLFGITRQAEKRGRTKERLDRRLEQDRKEARADEARDAVERLDPDARRDRLRGWSD